ncbi:hypothetical protein AVEN_22112-1 [Araneus ventricosus]|uniref:Uncharacterized protein n=1 Tax=Araneus ventricosus TaxID=182803 RepID=A0A4Y2QS57_ARAVE|nr:hypothetical protein AVEN_22112-1 [Araneus ventricosus]
MARTSMRFKRIEWIVRRVINPTGADLPSIFHARRWVGRFRLNHARYGCDDDWDNNFEESDEVVSLPEKQPFVQQNDELPQPTRCCHLEKSISAGPEKYAMIVKVLVLDY